MATSLSMGTKVQEKMVQNPHITLGRDFPCLGGVEDHEAHDRGERAPNVDFGLSHYGLFPANYKAKSAYKDQMRL
jgi:hypothetical protein